MSMPRPAINRATKTGGVAGTRGPALKGFIQWKVCINSAVSKTAGTTIENAIVQSKLYWSGVNKSRPRYSPIGSTQIEQLKPPPHRRRETKEQHKIFA